MTRRGRPVRRAGGGEESCRVGACRSARHRCARLRLLGRRFGGAAEPAATVHELAQQRQRAEAAEGRQDVAAEGHGRGRAEDEQHVVPAPRGRPEEHTSELQSLMRITYAVLCMKKKKKTKNHNK